MMILNWIQSWIRLKVYASLHKLQHFLAYVAKSVSFVILTYRDDCLLWDAEEPANILNEKPFLYNLICHDFWQLLWLLNFCIGISQLGKVWKWIFKMFLSLVACCWHALNNPNQFVIQMKYHKSCCFKVRNPIKECVCLW